MRNSFFAAAIGCALLAVASTPVPPVEPENTKCPISGKAVDPDVTTTIKRNIGFCWGGCSKKFGSNSSGFLAAVLKIENKIVNEVCPLSGKAIDESKSAEYKGDKVGFCCGNCLKKFKAAPAKFSGKIKNAGKPFNDACPVKGKAAKASQVVKFKKVVAFCCGNCKKKFDANPAKFAGKLQ